MCDDGVAADRSKMKAARVVPAGRRVSIEGVSTLADFDAAIHADGLAMTLRPAGLGDWYRPLYPTVLSSWYGAQTVARRSPSTGANCTRPRGVYPFDRQKFRGGVSWGITLYRSVT